MSGCSEPSLDLAEVAPTPFDAAAANAKAISEATQQAAEPAKEVQTAAVPSEPQVVYEAPFPDRTDLFEPLKHAARTARTSSSDSTDSIVLLGFANLDEPRALLAINGVVKPLTNGEESSGVRVISIEPPRAVLQRGRSRWTASIE